MYDFSQNTIMTNVRSKFFCPHNHKTTGNTGDLIPIYRKDHPKKERGPINWGLVGTFSVGTAGSLLMGFGMSRIMVGTPTKVDMIVGMITGVIGLLICVLNYPIYAYIRKDK